MPAAKLDLKPEDIWWHKKGYYRIFVKSLIGADNRTWVEYFALENCDDTYKEFKGDRFQGKDPLRSIKGNFYEKNQVCVMELDRFLGTFVPKKPELIKDIEPMVLGPGSEELVFRPLNSIFGQGVKKGAKKAPLPSPDDVEKTLNDQAKAAMDETLKLAQEHLATLEVKPLEPEPQEPPAQPAE